MEILLVLAIILIAVAGLGIGLVIGRGPLKGSCDGMACLENAACEGCPHRKNARRT